MSITSSVGRAIVIFILPLTPWTGNATNIAIWSTIEPGAGIIAGCLATLRPFVKGVFLKARTIRSSIGSSKKDMSNSSNLEQTHTGPETVSAEKYRHMGSLRSERGTHGNIHRPYDEHAQTRGKLCREGGSAECILEEMEPAYTITSRSRESLELDPEACVTRYSQSSLSPIDRTRVRSYEQSTLSTSAGTGKGTSWLA